MVVSPDLGDLAVAHRKPLGAAIKPLLTRLRVAPGHRPLDHGFVPLLDPVLDEPLAIDVVDTELGVGADPLGAFVRSEACVVVDRVLGEVLGDPVSVAAVEGVVVAADVVEVAQD